MKTKIMILFIVLIGIALLSDCYAKNVEVTMEGEVEFFL